MSKPPSSPVAYRTALSQASADKRIDILRLVGASGSISQAARDAGVSYKAAWQAIDTLTNLAGVALVARAVGGAGGGGAQLTPAGVELLAAADALARARGQVLARLQAPGASPALQQLSIRTSMRNQLPCAVTGLEGTGAIVRVQLALADGTALVARITRESVELLGLRPGQAVVALCKATAVLVQPAGSARPPPGRNLLQGRAMRVSRGGPDDGGDEVTAGLAAGLALVGFAPPGSALRATRRVQLLVDESALVLALPG